MRLRAIVRDGSDAYKNIGTGNLGIDLGEHVESSCNTTGGDARGRRQGGRAADLVDSGAGLQSGNGNGIAHFARTLVGQPTHRI